MTPCLSPEEFVDLTDGTLPEARRTHVESCAACQATAADVRDALALVADDDVPEPSPFFWSSVNARVGAEIRTESRSGWRRGWRWAFAAPLAVAAVALVAVAVGTRPSAPPAIGVARVDVPSAPATAAVSPAFAETGSEPDVALALVVDLTQGLPDGGWDTLGVTTLPDLADAARLLSVEEQAALADLLRTAVGRPTS